MSTQHWTVQEIDTKAENKHDGKSEDRCVTVLFFKQREVMRGNGLLSRDNIKAQADEWNRSGYIPKNGSGECLADHPPEKRSEVLKRMKNSTEAFPSLIIDVESNRNAHHKFKNSALGPRS